MKKRGLWIALILLISTVKHGAHAADREPGKGTFFSAIECTTKNPAPKLGLVRLEIFPETYIPANMADLRYMVILESPGKGNRLAALTESIEEDSANQTLTLHLSMAPALVLKLKTKLGIGTLELIDPSNGVNNEHYSCVSSY